MFAIDLPAAARLTLNSPTTISFSHRARYAIACATKSAPTSVIGYGLGESAELLQRALQLAERLQPKSIELAHRIRTSSANDLDVVKKVLEVFRTEPFFYTLVPPELGPRFGR